MTYKNRQEFDMLEQEEGQCLDPACRRIFAHKAHTDTQEKATTRTKDSQEPHRPTVTRSRA